MPSAPRTVVLDPLHRILRPRNPDVMATWEPGESSAIALTDDPRLTEAEDVYLAGSARWRPAPYAFTFTGDYPRHGPPPPATESDGCRGICQCSLVKRTVALAFRVCWRAGQAVF
jgi:hypothetical protein